MPFNKIQNYLISNKHTEPYWVLLGLRNSLRLLKKQDDIKQNCVKNRKRRLNYLRRQILWHYLKNIFLSPFWLVSFLAPSFLKGNPNLWTNLRTILREKEFRPLRMAIISWVLFLFIIVRGGIYLARHSEPIYAATYTWVQSSWTNSSTSRAAHSSDRTGWVDFYMSDENMVTSTELTLNVLSSSTVHTSTADFNAGTTSSVVVASGSITLDVDASAASTTVMVSVGGFTASVCGLTDSGDMYCWGANADGELGDNTITDRHTPVQVLGVGGSGNLTNLASISVSAGSDINVCGTNNVIKHTCAAKSNGTVYCWGENNRGNFGDNTRNDSRTPIQTLGVGGVGNLTGIVQVSGGTDFTCALDNSGSVFCWGENASGQLGINSVTDSFVPVQVLGVGGTGYLSNITQISAGDDHVCAIDTSNNLYCWGNNYDGQLGDGTVTYRRVPVQVVGVGGTGNLTSIVDVSAGYRHTCAADSSGNAYCWGSNEVGQLGDNSSSRSLSPVQVVGVGGAGNLSNITNISAADTYIDTDCYSYDTIRSHTCARDSNGAVYCWGENSSGQLGDGSTTNRNTPVQVLGVGGTGNISGITGIDVGGRTSCAYDTNGAVYCWGNNSRGQLGDNTLTNRTSPVRVLGVGASGNFDLTNTVYLSSGTFTSSIIDTVSTTAYGTMTWTTSTQANTSVTIKVRTGQKSDMSDAAAWGSCTAVANSGDDISSIDCVTDGDRYIQYQVALATTDTSVTPELQDVTINFSQYIGVEQTLVSSEFNSENPANIVGSIAWTETLPSGTDIKFQIRTAPDSGGAPGTWTSWLGPTDGNDYYTDPTGGESINSTHTDMTDDQWVQYKVFLSTTDYSQTPTLSDVTFTYVVNDPPVFDGIGVVATQLSNGNVSITFSVKDEDTGTSTSSFAYSLDNGATWTTTTGYLSSNATSSRSISTWTTSTIVWAARNVIDGQSVAQARIRVAEDDGEAANNISLSTSDAFALDVKDPVLGSPAIKIIATTTPAVIYNNVTDDNSLEMIVSLNSDLSGANWESYASTKTLSLSTDPDTVYAQFRDSYANTTTLQSATTPDTPSNLIIRDLSNVDTGDYQLFIAWGTVQTPSPGFNRYDIWSSANGSTYTLLNTITDRTTNYFLHQGLSNGDRRYYKIATVDSNGNTSYFSSVVNDSADGQGGTDATIPTISNVATSNITTQSFTVTWDTDELSSSSVAYSVSAFGGAFTTTTVNTMADSSSGSIGQHSVTITGLSPNTDYYFQVASNDPSGNIVFDTNGGDGYSVTTLNGPSISNVSIQSVDNNEAVITWITSVSASSSVYYSLSSDLSNSTKVTNTDLVTSHSVSITGLTAGTKYYFYVESNNTTDTNGGNYYNFTTTNDTTAPAISGAAVTPIADTYAVIVWTTDEGATSQVSFGTASGSYTSTTVLVTNLNKNHSVRLGGLTAKTKYYYVVASVDASNNGASSTEGSFTTLDTLTEEPDVVERESAARTQGVEIGINSSGGGGSGGASADRTKPKIYDLEVRNVGADSAEILWKTTKSSNSIVEFGINTSYGQAIADLLHSTAHKVNLFGLLPSTDYHFRAVSIDGNGNSGESEDKVFTTLSDSDIDIITTPEISGKINDAAKFGAGDHRETDKRTDDNVFLEAVNSTVDLLKRMSNQVSVNILEKALFNQQKAMRELAGLIPAPLIGGQPVVEVGSTYAKIYWTTDKKSDSFVAIAPNDMFKSTGEYTQVIGNANDEVTEHTVEVTELRPNTVYHYQVRSKTPISSVTASPDFTFKTKKEIIEIENYRINSISPSAAVFSWSTTVPTNSSVAYTPYRNGVLAADEKRSVSDSAFTLSHEIEIGALESGVVYQIEFSGEDFNGNVVSKIIQGFSTGDTDVPPIIFQVQTDAAILPGEGNKIQAIISWQTNELSTSRVYYQKGFAQAGDFSKSTPLQPNFVKKHVVVITDFDPGSVYQFKVESTDLGGNTAKSRTYTILTPRQKESVFKVITSNMEDIFGWVGKLGF